MRSSGCSGGSGGAGGTTRGVKGAQTTRRLSSSEHREHPERHPSSYEAAASAEPNLLHEPDKVIEEPLLGDLAPLVPRGHGAELHVEALVRRRDRLVPHLHGTFHGAVEVRDRARVVPVREQNLIWPIDEVVVRERLEEFHRFHVMVVPSPGGRRPAGPGRPPPRTSAGRPQGTGVPCSAPPPSIPVPAGPPRTMSPSCRPPP